MERVIPALLEVAKELRTRNGGKDVKAAAAAGLSESALKKFEKRDSGKPVDRWANALAKDAGVSVFDLWRQAIERAEKKSAAGPPPPLREKHLDGDEAPSE